MYIYVCVYQARGVSSHVYICVGTHTHIYMTTHSSGLVPTHIYIHDYSLLWLDTHTYIYMTTHSSGLCIYVCGYQARGVSSHVYMCVWVSSQRSE
jgi:hypothetical protein